MTLAEAKKLFPKEFIIANQRITVNIQEVGEDFGDFDSLRNIINVNLAAKDYKGNLAVFTKEQVENSYYHELVHCFNFLFNTELDEALAQSFANLICEYLNTKIEF